MPITRSAYPPGGAGMALVWMISRSDLQRYTYRAVKAVSTLSRRVISIPVRKLRSAHLEDWVLLCNITATRGTLDHALKAFRGGRAIRVRLGNLVALRGTP